MMKGLLGRAAGPAGGGGAEKAPEGASEEDTEVLEDDSKNILLSMISQLRPGSDLSRLTFPTFVLEPRSMLERITDFLSHPDLIFGAGEIDDPNERFVQVLRYYLAGWHIKPKGVKKPYNPILGEIFRCRYKYKDGSRGFYIAEQVSHHPPISAFYYSSPENNLEIFGELKPKSRFLGNSAANEMGGYNHIILLDRPEDGEYDISMPNMYARGILFGKMVLELGDFAKVSNNASGAACDVEFKTKGFFSGTYNAIHGKIKGSKGSDIGEISGKWSDQMYLQRTKGQKELFFDAHKATAVPKEVAPETDQDDNESRKLWSKVTAAIKTNDQDAATDAKSAIEDQQRDLARQREMNGETWEPQYFTLKNGEYRPMFSLPKGKSNEQIDALESWIFGTSSGTTADPSPVAATTSAPEEAAPTSAPASAPEETVASAPSTASVNESAAPVAPAAAAAVPASAVSNQPKAVPASAADSRSSAQASPVAVTGSTTSSAAGSGSTPSSPEHAGTLHSLMHKASLHTHRKHHKGSISGTNTSSAKSSAGPASNVSDTEASSRKLPSA